MRSEICMRGSYNDQNIYRWDRTAHKFVVDNRLQLHLDAPNATRADL